MIVEGWLAMAPFALVCFRMGHGVSSKIALAGMNSHPNKSTT
jgi:hypothetical protein